MAEQDTKNNDENKPRVKRKYAKRRNSAVKQAQSKTQPKKVYRFADDGKIHTTYDEYDALVKELDNDRFQRDNWWPSKQDIEMYVEPNFELCYEFVVWLVETSPNPANENDKMSKKLLNNLLIKYIVFDDDEE